jgi:hypothetical protein
LSLIDSHPLGNNNPFHEISPNSKVSDLPWRDEKCFYLSYPQNTWFSEPIEITSLVRLSNNAHPSVTYLILKSALCMVLSLRVILNVRHVSFANALSVFHTYVYIPVFASYCRPL